MRAEAKRTDEGKEPDRRRAILRAAIGVFASKGYHGARMSDVAHEANVAYGLVYHYFDSKEALLEAVFELTWAGFVSRIRDAVRSSHDLSAQVRGVIAVGFEAYRIDPKGVRVVLLEVARSPAASRLNRQSAFGEVTRIAAEAFQEAVVRKELSPRMDPLVAAAMLVGALESLLTTFLMGMVDVQDEESLAAAQDQLAETFLSGVLGQRKSAATTDAPST